MSLGFAKFPFPTKCGSCGTVVRNAEMKVIHPLTSLSLPRNEHGEICVRGSQIMKGYLNDEKATAETIDADGWLHTGDIGYVDDDDEVFLVDRAKELIKFKAFQVRAFFLDGKRYNFLLRSYFLKFLFFFFYSTVNRCRRRNLKTSSGATLRLQMQLLFRK